MFKYETSEGKFELVYGEISFLKRNEKNADILSVGVRTTKKAEDKPVYLTGYKKTADIIEKINKKGDKQAFLCFVKENGQYTNYNINRVGDMNIDVTTTEGKELKVMKGTILFVNKKDKFITIGIKGFGMAKEDKPVYITFGEKAMAKVEKYCEKGKSDRSHVVL